MAHLVDGIVDRGVDLSEFNLRLSIREKHLSIAQDGEVAVAAEDVAKLRRIGIELLEIHACMRGVVSITPIVAAALFDRRISMWIVLGVCILVPDLSGIENGGAQPRVAVHKRVAGIIGGILIDRQTVARLVGVEQALCRHDGRPATIGVGEEF